MPFEPDTSAEPDATRVKEVRIDKYIPGVVDERGMVRPDKATIDKKLAGMREEFYRELLGMIPQLTSGVTGALTAGPALGLGSVPAATIGAVPGSIIENVILDKMGYDTEPVKDIAYDAVTGGLSQLLGLGVGKTTNALGRVINKNMAVRPEGELLREHPDLMDVINKERFPIGTAEKPSMEIRDARSYSAKLLEDLMDDSKAAGEEWTLDPTKPPQEILELLSNVASGKEASSRVGDTKMLWKQAIRNARSREVGGRTIPEQAKKVTLGRGRKSLSVPRQDALDEIAFLRKHLPSNPRLKKMLDDWERAVRLSDTRAASIAEAKGTRKVALDAKQMKGLKRSHAGEGANVAKVARKAQNIVPPGVNLESEFDNAMGRALRRMIEEKNPYLAARDTRTSSLIGAEKAINAAELRGGPKMAHFFGGPGVLLDMLVSPVLEPRNVNFAARGLMNPKFNQSESVVSKPILDRMMQAIINRRLYQDEGTETFEPDVIP